MSVPRSSLRPTHASIGVAGGLRPDDVTLPGRRWPPPSRPRPEAADEVLVRYRADTTARRARARRPRARPDARVATSTRTVAPRSCVAERPLTRDRSDASSRTTRDVLGRRADNQPARARPTTSPTSRASASCGASHNTRPDLDGIEPQTGIADVDIDGLEALRSRAGDPTTSSSPSSTTASTSAIPDLADRAWTNPGEAGAKAANGVDDDGNGYIDDVHGWDFCNDDNTVSDPGEDFHGTHVAGTIAASLNGAGRRRRRTRHQGHGRSSSSTTPSTAAPTTWRLAAIDYARLVRRADHQRIVGRARSEQRPARRRDRRIRALLFVAARPAIAAGVDHGPRRPAVRGLSSQPRPQPNIVTVAAIDQRGNWPRSRTTARRRSTSRLPGTNILSSIPSEPDCDPAGRGSPARRWPHRTCPASRRSSSASCAAPPTPSALRARLLSSGQPLASTVGKTATGRLVNALRAIDRVGPVALPINRHGINVGIDRGLERQHDDDVARRHRRPERRQGLRDQAQSQRHMDDPPDRAHGPNVQADDGIQGPDQVPAAGPRWRRQSTAPAPSGRS